MSHKDVFIALPFFGENTIKLLTGWLGGTMVVTFTLFYTIHAGSEFIELGVPQLPTISYTGALFPGNVLLTFALHMSAILVAYMFLAIYVAFEGKFNEISESQVMAKHDLFGEYYIFYCCCNPSSTTVPSLRKWNKVLLWLGLSSAGLMALVGSVTLTMFDALHGALAFLMFITAIVHMFLFYLLVRRFVPMDPAIRTMHRIACASCFPVPIFMFIAVGILYANCKSYDCRSMLVSVGPVSEFINVAGLALYAYTFQDDIAGTSLVIVNRKSDQVVFSGAQESSGSQQSDSSSGVDPTVSFDDFIAPTESPYSGHDVHNTA
jgi:hypothetical protein